MKEYNYAQDTILLKTADTTDDKYLQNLKM